MKKYMSRATKWLAFLASISVAVLITGIAFIFAKFSNVGLQIGLTMSGGLTSVLFLSFFFAEKSRYLTIDGEKVVLPRGVDVNGKTSFQRTAINMDEIRSVESNMYKGDGIISKDTRFHTLKLKDGTTIRFTLYAYVKDAENEILETIKEYLVNSNMSN